MRKRPSARLIVLNAQGEVLLFRFDHRKGALAGRSYWATPGGAVEEGETFAEAARRELLEETGIKVDAVGPKIGERNFVLQLDSGEHVLAEERFFLVRTDGETLSRDGWTAGEMAVMADHRWWSKEAIAATTETIYPENIGQMLAKSGGA